jgi:D-sedoheptulose 7-phosphate isomerase
MCDSSVASVRSEACDALVQSALLVAERFRSGGSLVAVGRGRAAADARHLAVEFLHPVIVGKPALSAVVGDDRADPRDVLVEISYERDSISRADVLIAPSGASDEAIHLEIPGDHVGAKVAAVTAYHVLWELTHVFLELPTTLGHTGSDLDALYPMLYRETADDAERLAAATDSTMAKLVESHAVQVQARAENTRAIRRAADLVAAATTIFTFGNGGSSTDASDLAWLLGSNGRALSDDIATVTALANDVGFDVVFARPLATLGARGDVAVALSTSGNSPNVLAGLAEAKRRGMHTIGIAGYDGGAMAEADLDVLIVVRSSSIHRIQEAQVGLYEQFVTMSGRGRRPPLPDRS